MSEGHDTFLLEAGRLFGMRLRELHPPEAAVGLEASAEFAQHFEASYRPLMELALEHGQPVLVRRGWPSDCDNLWGVVTARCPEDLGFAGVVPGGSRAGQPMALPPVQVYVAEEITPRDVSGEALLRYSLSVGRRVLCSQLDERLEWVTGHPAYEAWTRRLDAPDLCPCGRHGGAACHARMARAVRQARQYAAEFVERCGEAMAPTSGDVVAAFKETCSSVVQSLDRSCNEREVEKVLAEPGGRSRLAADLRRAQHHDQAAARLIERILQGK